MLLNLPEIQIDQLQDPLFTEKDVEVYLQREDLIHPIISGNKWRKLRFNIEKARQLGKTSILTFGGAHSNHLIATAEACLLANLKSIGIVRGEEISTQTLTKCRDRGMDLHFISREEYRMHESKEYINHWYEKFHSPFIIPQGGDNYYGTLGCTEILKACPFQPDFIFVAAGTGNTTAGILISANENQTIASVPALKGDFMKKEIQKSILNFIQNEEATSEYMGQLIVLDQYHFGGFAKYTSELIQFIKAFYVQHRIQLDPIYTGKMMFGLYDQIRNDALPKNSKILAIHTGGLQGISGFEKRYGIQLVD
ncbi:MAG: pyridoxal-phosphate dependent enzyme [Crocinitomicaceae bacterium]